MFNVNPCPTCGKQPISEKENGKTMIGHCGMEFESVSEWNANVEKFRPLEQKKTSTMIKVYLAIFR